MYLVCFTFFSISLNASHSLNYVLWENIALTLEGISSKKLHESIRGGGQSDPSPPPLTPFIRLLKLNTGTYKQPLYF